MNSNDPGYIMVDQGEGNPPADPPLPRDFRVHHQYLEREVMYRPCFCGSGKKFKFCCYKNRKKTNEM